MFKLKSIEHDYIRKLKCQSGKQVPGSVGRSMLDLESRGPGSIPTKGGVIFCFKFCNPNLHNIARSDKMRFKTKNPIVL